VGALAVPKTSITLQNPIQIQLPTTTTYKYLVVSWDGSNSGSEVYYIGNVPAGTLITVPEFVLPNSSGDLATGTKYDITSYTLLNPTAVPEPSTMIAGALLLLPFGVSTLRVLRRNRA
jgi:hypothetical protein